MASTYSIKELEHLSGIKAHTLRVWEQRYSIITPERTDSNIRYYSEEDLRTVLNISLLSDHGFRISKIAEMKPDERCKCVLDISEAADDYVEQIRLLTLGMVELDESRFNKIISRGVLKEGFEKTMINIVLPFLQRIGVLWIAGSVNPAQEHFISHLIRKKIIVATESQPAAPRKTAPKILMFLPENEEHELTLLFANYLASARKFKVIYLGQGLPLKDVCHALDIHKPEFIMSIFTTHPASSYIQEYVESLSQCAKDSQVLLTGHQALTQAIECPENVRLVYQINDFVELLEKWQKPKVTA